MVNVAMCRVKHWQYCLSSTRMGSRSVWANSKSVAVECIPLVIVRVAMCCTDFIFLVNPLTNHPFCLVNLPGSNSVVAHMSAAYRILGTAVGL